MDNLAIIKKEVDELVLEEMNRTTIIQINNTYQTIDSNKISSQSFAYLIDCKTNRIILDSKFDHYFHVPRVNRTSFIFDYIHPSYIMPFYECCKAILQLTKEPYPSNLEHFSYRINLPVKLKSGFYYWSLHEYCPYKVNKKIETIGVSVTILFPYNKSNENHFIDGEIWSRNTKSFEYTSRLLEIRKSLMKFHLSPALYKIINILNESPNITNQDLAEILNKTKNNIDMQKKMILNKARLSFAYKKFDKVSDVVLFLRGIGWFDK